MANLNKYNRRWEDYENPDDFLKLFKYDYDAGKQVPVKISKDGRIYARGFVDENDQLELYVDNLGEVKCKFSTPNLATFRHEELETTRSYSYVTTALEVLNESFQNFLNPVTSYSNTEPTAEHKKYDLLNRKTKAEISSKIVDMQNPKAFHFHFKRGNHYHVEPNVESTWLGPWNYSVFLEPDEMIKDIADLVIIKSGKFKEFEDSPVLNTNAAVMFSSGVSGHIYVETVSIPEHSYSAGAAPDGWNNAVRTFKFKDSGNILHGEAVTPISGGAGVIGLIKNGVFLHGVRDSASYNASGKWHENLAETESMNFDMCLGKYQDNTSLDNHEGYYYQVSPTCVYDELDTTGHSPLLGFAKDGFPIYGAHGYSSPSDPTSAIKRIETSYRLKSATTRVEGPSFASFSSGSYVEDFEYVNGLGDLDEHNGRTGVTPEFPNGTYAYYTTLNDELNPQYPYVIGPTYYGFFEDTDGYGGIVSEAPLYVRHKKFSYPPNISTWKVWGDTHTHREGLESEKIIYVSPHTSLNSNGVFLKTGELQYYKSDGATPATFSGNKWQATGNGNFMTFETGYKYPSSENCHQRAFQRISGGMDFVFNDPDTSITMLSQGHERVTGTYFYEMYSGHKRVSGKVHDITWDGKIPAGTPIKIETWAFNGYTNGFEGKYMIKPCEHHPLTSGNVIAISTQITGHGETEQEARENANAQSREFVRKELQSLMVNSGVKDENTKIKAWKRLKSTA